jgi:hypothetical protein
MTLHKISDLQRRYQYYSTYAAKQLSSVGIHMAHWKYCAQAKVIKN